MKLQQNGISFKGSHLSGISIDANVDGFMQLVTAQRSIETLRADKAKVIHSFNELQTLQERKEQETIARYNVKIEEIRSAATRTE